MTESTEKECFPLEVLAAGGDGLVVGSRGGDLYISDQRYDLKQVCGAAVASAKQSLIVVLTLQKEAVVLSRDMNSDVWKEVARHLMPKRPTSALFAIARQRVVVADAFGDVYALPIASSVNLRDDQTQAAVLLLGHFSTVTSLALEGPLIASADRDAKLRISRFPNSFVIESFCIAHQEFITCVQWIGPKRLISGAGDGTLRCWNAADGSLLNTVDIRDHIPRRSSEEKTREEKVVVACIEAIPGNDDVVVIGLYKKNFLIILSGISSNFFKLRVVTAAKEGDWITGVAADDRDHLWLSLASSCHSVQAYSTKELGTPNIALTRHRLMTIHCTCSDGSKKSPNGKNDSTAFPMRFEWLNQQRKREMVEDWKGKKRKHIEI